MEDKQEIVPTKQNRSSGTCFQSDWRILTCKGSENQGSCGRMRFHRCL